MPACQDRQRRISWIESAASIVSNASGLGILQAKFCPRPIFRENTRRVRELTTKPFGVNLLLHFLVEDQVTICLGERMLALSFFWGDSTPYIGRAHAAGVKVFHQVGSARTSRRSVGPLSAESPCRC